MKVSLATLSLLVKPSVAAQWPTYFPTVGGDDSTSTEDDEVAAMITKDDTKVPTPTYAPGPSWDDDSSGEDSTSSASSGYTPAPVPSPYIDIATPAPSSVAYSSASAAEEDSTSTSTYSPTADKYYASSTTASPTGYPESSAETYQSSPSSYVTVEEISSVPTLGDGDDRYPSDNSTMPGQEGGSREPIVAAAQTPEYANGAAASGAFSFLILGLSSVVIGMN